MYRPNKVGLIYFSYRNRNLVSTVINLFQTGKIKNYENSPSHTSQSILRNGKYEIHDADWPGVRSRSYDKWKKGRAYIIVIDPCLLKNSVDEWTYSQEAIKHIGDRYGFEDIKGFVEKYTGQPFTGESDPDKADDTMICSIMTAYLYKFKNWWNRYPKDLLDNIMIDAPNFKIVYSGKP